MTSYDVVIYALPGKEIFVIILCELGKKKRFFKILMLGEGLRMGWGVREGKGNSYSCRL